MPLFQNFNISKQVKQVEKDKFPINKPSQSFKSNVSKYELSTSTKSKVTYDHGYKSFSKYSRDYSNDCEMKLEDYDLSFIKNCHD